MRRLPRLPLLAALALLAACGPMLYVEVTIPEVRVELPSQTFPPFTGVVPVDMGCGPSCIFKEMDYDFGDAVPFLGDDNVDVDLRLTGLALDLAATSGNLGGVKSIAFKLVNPDDPADFVVAASYVRTDGAPTSLSVSGNANVDLARYLTGTGFRARAEMTYDAPTPEFTAEIGAQFSIVLKVDYGAYVGL